MKAIKDNKEYTITEAEKKTYIAQGYDIVKDGKIVSYGAGKTVSYDEYKKLEAKCKELETKLKELETTDQEETKEKKTAKK